MNKFASFIVKGRYWFLGIFFVLLVASAVLMNFVKVNYDLTEYLPDSSSTKQSIKLMEKEFGATGTASVMIANINQDKAEFFAKKIQNLENVSTSIVSRYQEKDGKGYALIAIFLVNGDYTQEAEQALKDIKNIFEGDEGLSDDQNYYLIGSAETAVSSRTSILGEIPIILLVAVLVVIFVLLFTTRSWIEPLIFLIVIGSAILINMGTNYLLGSISFISNSVSAVLLIALAMDYSIVLVNRFREEREKESDIYLAMKNAIGGSIVTICASGLTVMAGLASLMFMDYKIGFDMGIVLTKGVFISLLAVIFLMPAVLLLFSKILKKTEHKNFLKGVAHLGTFAKKTMWVFPILFLCLIGGAFAIEHTKLEFDYVAKFSSKGPVYESEQQVKQVFGAQNSLVVILKTKNDEQIILTPEQQIEIFNHIKQIKVDDQEVINLGSSFMSSSGKVPSPVQEGKEIEIFVGQKIDAQYILDNFTKTDDPSKNLLTLMLNGQLINLCGGDASGIYVYQAISYAGQNFTLLTNQMEQILLQVKTQYSLSEADYQALRVAYIDTMIPLVASKYDKLCQGEEVYNSPNYTRMIFNINSEPASQTALTFITELNSYLKSLNPDIQNFEFNVVCNSQNVLETQNVFKTDRLKVDLIAALAILLICLASFRSVSLPVLLVAIIEGSIFINLAGNALLGNSIFFICYLLGTAIQMGATIDYGILLCDRYKEARRTQDKFSAIKTAISNSFATILSSGSILTLAALSIGIFSSIPLLSSIGYLIGFGALCASFSILFVLPQTLILLDKFISKTTYKSNFLFGQKQKPKPKQKEKITNAKSKKIEKTKNEIEKQK